MTSDRITSSRDRCRLRFELGSSRYQTIRFELLPARQSAVERAPLRCSVCEAVPRPVGAACSLCKRIMGESGPIDLPIDTPPAPSASPSASRGRDRGGFAGEVGGGASQGKTAFLPTPAILSFADFFRPAPEFRGIGQLVEELARRVVEKMVNDCKAELEARIKVAPPIPRAPVNSLTDGGRV